MLLLVVLRVTIGWHFFKEGMSHYHDPKWSSEGFLRQAKGPFADLYKSALPEDYPWRKQTAAQAEPAGDGSNRPENVYGDQPPGDTSVPAWQQWAADESEKWEAHRKAFSQFNELTPDQEAASKQVLAVFKTRLEAYLSDIGEDLDKHLRELNRWAQAKAENSSSEVPYQRSRVADQERKLTAERNGWDRDVQEIQVAYHNALDKIVAAGDGAKFVPVASVVEPTSLRLRDRYLTYGLIAAGGLLVVGLFTRLAAVAAGLFLLSVIMTQPPWVTGTTPTYNQFVEMMALFTLASTAVGRWGGLDFFVHRLITWPFRKSAPVA